MAENEPTEAREAELLRLAATDPALRRDEKLTRLLQAVRKRVAELLGLD